MREITIRAKLIILFGAMALMLVVIGVLGLSGMRATNASLGLLYKENLATTETLSRIVGLMRENRVQLLLALMHDPGSKWHNMHDHPVTLHTDQVKNNVEEVKALWKSYCAIPRSADETQLSSRFEAACLKVVNEGMRPAMGAILAGKYDEASRLTLQVTNPSFMSAKEAMAALLKNETQQAGTEYAAAAARYGQIRAMIVAGVLLALLIGAVFGFLIVRSIGSATLNLVRVSSRLADGDLTARVDLASRDEMGQMGDSFNRMGDAFFTLIGQIKENMVQLASAVDQLMATSGEMAHGSENVATQIGAVATASEEMAATSTEIAHNCITVAENSRQANDAAINGAMVVQASVEIMNRIADRVRETARTVEGLGSRSDQIGEIVGTIEDIADQTNLLALNAAIEAARAGEQGRGFAVVADEVRALAERTAKATKEIGEMIRTIQQETKAVVASMDDGVKEVETGTSEAARSGNALQEIIEQINAVNVRVNEIATAAEQQTATTNEISNNILQISEVVSEAARGAQDSASAASQLSCLAGEMESLVGRFRVAG